MSTGEFRYFLHNHNVILMKMNKYRKIVFAGAIICLLLQTIGLHTLLKAGFFGEGGDSEFNKAIYYSILLSIFAFIILIGSIVGLVKDEEKKIWICSMVLSLGVFAYFYKWMAWGI